jgi:MFS family permease
MKESLLAEEEPARKSTRDLFNERYSMALQSVSLDESRDFSAGGAGAKPGGQKQQPSSDGDAGSAWSPEDGVPTLLLIGSYSSFASMYMVVSLIGPFFPPAATKWGFDPDAIGIICACDPIGEILSTVFATWVMAKMGAVRAACAGMIGNGISSIIFGFLPMYSTHRSFLYPMFVIMRLSNGAATNVTYISAMTLLCCLMPDKIGAVTGNVAVLTTIGLIAGPPFGSVMATWGQSLVTSFDLNKNFSFAVPFIGATVLLVAPTFVLWRSREQADAAEKASAESEDVSRAPIARSV